MAARTWEGFGLTKTWETSNWESPLLDSCWSSISTAKRLAKIFSSDSGSCVDTSISSKDATSLTVTPSKDLSKRFLQSFFGLLYCCTLLLKNGWPLDSLVVREKLCLEEKRKDQLDCMGCTVINDECNFPVFLFKLIVKLSDPIFEKRWIHPVFVLALVTTR